MIFPTLFVLRLLSFSFLSRCPVFNEWNFIERRKKEGKEERGERRKRGKKKEGKER